MLILIAESKTMGRCEQHTGPLAYNAHRPATEDVADEIMESLRGATAEELATDVKISLPLARKLMEMIYEFPNKKLGGEAVKEFTGVVFKALDASSLSSREHARLCKRVRIISSLYGWLKPDDIIKQYRLDFTTPVAPDGKTLAAYWRETVTELLMKTIDAEAHEDIINLLPGDAARCIDWRSIEKRAKVWKIDFQEMLSGGKTRTPNAGRLKTLRGRLLRQIIVENINSATDLLSIEGNGYASARYGEHPDSILFHTVAD